MIIKIQQKCFLKSIAIGRCDIQLTFNGYTFTKYFTKYHPGIAK